MYGLRCPVPSTYGPLECIIKGFERGIAKPKASKLPITPHILANLLSSSPILPTLSWSGRVFKAVFNALYLVLFFSMLRSSNLLPDHKSGADPRRHLTWDRVHIHPQGVIIDVVLSKTIQMGERVHQIPLARIPGSPFLPCGCSGDIFQL